MNRSSFTKRVTDILRENNVKKPISVKKQVFHISDDEGNSKDFVIKKTDKHAIYTINDVDAIIEACLTAIKECLKQGDYIAFRGIGSLGLKYRKERSTKLMGTDIPVVIAGHYVPKFTFGDDLRLCAKLYELSLKDRLEEPSFEEGDDEVTDDEDTDESDGES